MKILKPEFVEFIPEKLQDGTLYVSMIYKTTVHLCACGCGQKVVTPLSPNDWVLTFDGRSITLYPSIGNWSFPCQSHYFIRQNKIVDVSSRERDNSSGKSRISNNNKKVVKKGKSSKRWWNW